MTKSKDKYCKALTLKFTNSSTSYQKVYGQDILFQESGMDYAMANKLCLQCTLSNLLLKNPSNSSALSSGSERITFKNCVFLVRDLEIPMVRRLIGFIKMSTIIRMVTVVIATGILVV